MFVTNKPFIYSCLNCHNVVETPSNKEIKEVDLYCHKCNTSFAKKMRKLQESMHFHQIFAEEK